MEEMVIEKIELVAVGVTANQGMLELLSQWQISIAWWGTGG
jgi:hypothetical protein